MKVAIHHGGKEGFVKYNKGNQEVMVTHPDVKVRNTVSHYLNAHRDFTMGLGDDNQKGNRDLVYTKPSNSLHDMVMGLCEMHHHTGVTVNWGHEENNLKDMAEEQPDPNAQADKPILKSLFDDGDFEIIN